ncbi:DHHW family protein [Anaerotalea alkaliphila]|uniref:DHHW protein n=1 Tax=Anaerotalea alkaliphila TaxID=2662126 RepID=A0A7X5HUR8_9FIRM|nr:DHHW family protein [Anaerotalea alkaliphila]NDL67057.1 hypothetical protein [Anaerotalea alkaliphila]
MKRQRRALLTIGLTGGLLLGTMALQVLGEDPAVSLWERRKLARFPEASVEKLLEGRLVPELEAYLADSFPFRDGFRRVKALLETQVFGKLDTNGYYKADGHISRLAYPLEEAQVALAAKKMQEIQKRHLGGMKVHYAAIPDKNYYLAEPNGYPSMDYGRLTEILQEDLRDMAPIDLFDCLDREDYYKTDPHWRQERLDRVVRRLGEEMGFVPTPFDRYERKVRPGFYGAYAGQSALGTKPEELVHLMGGGILETKAYHADKDEWTGVYVESADLAMDGYSYYLGGAAALQVLVNPAGETGRELILFRDSFAAPLAPLLMEAYDKVTLVDLRYMPSGLLGEHIDFGDQDVLFLYSTLVLNNGGVLR